MKFDIKNLHLHYGDFHALKGIDMQIPENKVTAFIGPSGCGKSTFLKTLNRMTLYRVVRLTERFCLTVKMFAVILK